MPQKTNKSSLLKKPIPVQKEPPTWVKVLSVLYFISAGLLIVVAIALVILSVMVVKYIELTQNSTPPYAETSSAGLLSILPPANVIIIMGIFGALFCIGFAVFHFFLAKGLWKLKNWARITLIVFSSLGALTAFGWLLLYSFISNLPGIAGSLVSVLLNGLVFLYLLRNEEVKKAFTG
jgi:hypothetical protein